MLQVAVNDGAAVAPGLFQPGEHGRFLAEVPAEVYAHHMAVVFGGALYHLPGGVLGAVVHEKQFIVDTSAFKDGGKALRRYGDHFFLVIGGENNRKHTDSSL